MINAIKSEIAFLKSHNLDQTLWKETSVQLIKRLTSEIEVESKEQREMLIDEVKDFLAKGGGKDDSFDFIFQEDSKFFKEIHIYRHKDKDGKEKVTARIDRTLIDENGKRKPFENFVRIDYEEDENEELMATGVNILGTKYTPFPANLVFAEHLFSKMAGDIVKGNKNDKQHYKNLESKALASIPDIYATPEQRSKDKELAEKTRYKIWDRDKAGHSDKSLHKEDFENDILMSGLLRLLGDAELKVIDTSGLTEEDIFKNLVNNITAKTAAQQLELKREAKDFFTPQYGDDSFDMSTNIADGSLIYKIARNHSDKQISATVGYKQNDGADPNKPQYTGKVKYVGMLDIMNMVYEEDPAHPGEFKLAKMTILGRNYPVDKQYEWLGTKFYNYLMHELQKPDSNHIDMTHLEDVLDIIDTEYQNVQFVTNEMLRNEGILLDASELTPQQVDEILAKKKAEEELQIQRKYEHIYNPELNYD